MLYAPSLVNTSSRIHRRAGITEEVGDTHGGRQ